jgi:hypothetical protein
MPSGLSNLPAGLNDFPARLVDDSLVSHHRAGAENMLDFGGDAKTIG